MQLQVNVNNSKSAMFLELLNVFKADEMISDYQVVSNTSLNSYQDSNDFSHLEDKIEDGLNSPISSKTHKEIFKELKSKYA